MGLYIIFVVITTFIMGFLTNWFFTESQKRKEEKRLQIINIQSRIYEVEGRVTMLELRLKE